MSALLDTALAYAADGLPVFPLHAPTAAGCTCGRDCGSPGKHPRTAHGLNDATTDPTTIREWWAPWPDANLGVRTGTPGGIVAADLDNLEAEIRFVQLAGGSLSDLVELEAVLGGGLVVHTGRGRHVWYRVPEGSAAIPSSAGRLGAGIDVRGAGGYVVAPPSMHRSGRRYSFAGGRLVSVPAWLLAELTRLDSPRTVSAPPPAGRAPLPTGGPTTRYGRGVIDRRAADVLAAPEGTLNYSLLRAATTCAGYAASGEVNLEEAREALLEAAVAAGHPARSALRTIESGFERGLGRPLYRPPSVVEQIRSGDLDPLREGTA